MDKLDEIRERAEKIVYELLFRARLSYKNEKPTEKSALMDESAQLIQYLLAEIARLRAENEGLRIELDDPRKSFLPCSVGDMVWTINGKTQSDRVERISITGHNVQFALRHSSYVYDLDEFGEIIFTSPERATEKAKEAGK